MALKEEGMEPDLWFLYRQMLRSRLFEESVIKLWEEGKISGEMHLGIGEEAIAAGTVSHLQEGDAMALDHRGTPPLVMRGLDLVLLLREFLGHPDGLCRGWGGHMHLFSPEFLSASSGIVGASGPMASGFALAAQYLRPKKLAIAFFGEGAMNQGMLMESLNLAVVWKLPVVFVCKDNELAISTHSPSVTGGNLIERAKSFGLVTIEIDGTDVEEVWKASRVALQRVRSGAGPVYLLAHCFHFEGHLLGDPLLRLPRNPLKEGKRVLRSLRRTILSKRGEPLGQRLSHVAEVIPAIRRAFPGKKARGRDPLRRLRRNLSKERLRLERLEKEVKQEIEEAVEKALSAEGDERRAQK